MEWRGWTRVDSIDGQMLTAMKKSGCLQLSFGIESGSQFMLDTMGKGTTVEENTRALKLAKNCDIETRSFFMIGFPGETPETLKQTTQYIIDQDLRDIVLFVFSPTVGCDTWKNPDKYGVLNFDKYDFSKQWRIGKAGTNMLYVDTKYMSGEQLHDEHLKMLDILHDRIAGFKK
jgi:radical SAM superfamily enzyme YgiQ (UPF0313 family)